MLSILKKRLFCNSFETFCVFVIDLFDIYDYEKAISIKFSCFYVLPGDRLLHSNSYGGRGAKGSPEGIWNNLLDSGGWR